MTGETRMVYHQIPSLRVEPLCPVQFAPYGEVLRNDESTRRNFYPAATAPGQAPGELRFWVSQVRPAGTAPILITRLERHPFAVQTFLPLKISRWLVVVTPSMPDGTPDVRRIRAFLAAPGHAIFYRRNTWHHGTIVLDETALFGVLMWRRTACDDDEFHDLAEPILLETGTQREHGGR